MKNFVLFIMTTTLLLAGLSGGSAMAAENTQKTQTITRFGTLPAYKGPSQFFTGTAWVQPLFDAKHPLCPVVGAYVTFEPGARSHWHNHPAGQHLVVTEGIGLTGTENGEVQEFRAGDVLWCPPDVKHWHGAAPNASMTHFSFAGTLPDGKNTNWLEPVTDAQYNSRK
jgi:quercetin dioxygenase-like cupin family protein